jgi:hypothetical protein
MACVIVLIVMQILLDIVAIMVIVVFDIVEPV